METINHLTLRVVNLQVHKAAHLSVHLAAHLWVHQGAHHLDLWDGPHTFPLDLLTHLEAGRTIHPAHQDHQAHQAHQVPHQ